MSEPSVQQPSIVEHGRQRVTNVEEWREVNQGLAFIAPRLQKLEANAETSEDVRTYFNQARDQWTNCVQRAATSADPYRDCIIRKKAYAFSRMMAGGQAGNEEAYQQALEYPYFRYEAEYYASQLPQEELQEEHKAAYDLDLSQYIERLAGVYCNALLNLADGKERELIQPEDAFYQELRELTAKLEERKMFDEMYLARIGVVGAFQFFTGVCWKQDAMQWAQQASELLSSHYNAPVVS